MTIKRAIEQAALVERGLRGQAAIFPADFDGARAIRVILSVLATVNHDRDQLIRHCIHRPMQATAHDRYAAYLGHRDGVQVFESKEEAVEALYRKAKLKGD